MKDAYSRRWRDHSSPYPGIRDLLSALSANGNRLGVLSNKPEAFTRQMVNHFFPDIPFAAVRGAREGVPVKPDPSAAQEIQKEWGVPPESILYAGDTDTDMKTGQAAGFWTVGVSWGFRDREELTTAGAHMVVDKPSDFLTLLADPPQGFIH
jgi:phosphoglycolate phosphatase